MPAASPELITDRLFEKLSPSLEKGENLLGEFELFGIIREAKKITIEDESLGIQGLAWIIHGDMKKGIELCEASLALNPNQRAQWGNYAIAVSQKAYHALQREILKRSVNTHNPSLMVFDFIVASFWADYKEMQRVKSLFKSLDKIELSDKQKEDYMSADAIYNTLSKLPDHDREQLSQMADLAMQIMSNRKIRARKSGQYVAPDGLLSFSYDIFDATPEYIVDLNDELATMIVEKKLYDAKSIVLFTPGD